MKRKGGEENGWKAESGFRSRLLEKKKRSAPLEKRRLTRNGGRGGEEKRADCRRPKEKPWFSGKETLLSEKKRGGLTRKTSLEKGSLGEERKKKSHFSLLCWGKN